MQRLVQEPSARYSMMPLATDLNSDRVYNLRSVAASALEPAAAATGQKDGGRMKAGLVDAFVQRGSTGT